MNRARWKPRWCRNIGSLHIFYTYWLGSCCQLGRRWSQKQESGWVVGSWETPLLSLLLDNQLFEEKTSHKLRSPGWFNDNPITVSSITTTTTNYVDHTLELGRPGSNLTSHPVATSQLAGGWQLLSDFEWEGKVFSWPSPQQTRPSMNNDCCGQFTLERTPPKKLLPPFVLADDSERSKTHPTNPLPPLPKFTLFLTGVSCWAWYPHLWIKFLH